jgi:hypothetical protein
MKKIHKFNVYFYKGKKSFSKSYRTHTSARISIRVLKDFGWKVEQTYYPKGYKNFGKYKDSGG